jgi:predicted esterase
VDATILKLLRSTDPAERRKAIIAAGKSLDTAYLKPLTQVYYTDSEAELRDLAQKACQHLRKYSTSETDAVKPPTPTPAAANRVRTVPRERPSRYSPPRFLMFLLFFAAVLSAAAAFVWYQRGDAIRYHLYLNHFNSELDKAREMKPGETDWGDLDGRVFQTQISETTIVYIQEPSGKMPEGGWSMVACIHGTNGNAMNCFNWMGDRAYYEGVIFIAPTYSGEGQGFQYTQAAKDMRIILDRVEDYYQINWAHTVIYGFSGGGMFASYYTANYPHDFAGAVFGSAPQYKLPRTDSPVKVAVVIGDSDGNLPYTSDYVTQMERRGTPVWRSLMLPNVGHNVTLDHVELTFVLLEELRRF